MVENLKNNSNAPQAKMNQYKEFKVDSIDFIFSEPSKSPDNGKNWFYIHIKINGTDINDFFKKPGDCCLLVNEYYKSINIDPQLKENDLPTFYFFTCTCGEPGCDSWFNGVRFLKEKETVTWIINEHHYGKIKFIFDADYYNQSFNKFLGQIKKYVMEHPGTVPPGQLARELEIEIYGEVQDKSHRIPIRR